jgi:hypothetical protein
MIPASSREEAHLSSPQQPRRTHRLDLALASAVALGALCAAALSSCGGTPEPSYGQPGTRMQFDLDADLTGAAGSAGFYALPFPSDLRLLPSGKQDWRAFAIPTGKTLVETFKTIAQERTGFSVLPVAWFRFTAALAQVSSQPIPAGLDQAAFLVDVDARSPRRGQLFPLWAHTPPEDDYVDKNVLALAPRPGAVLSPNRTYAFVVRRSFNDAAGKPLGVPAELDQLRRGIKPAGALGAAALANYQPLWDTLALLKVDATQVAAATVFTTGDAVAEFAALTDQVLQRDATTLSGLALDAAASTSNDRVCKLKANIDQPQFQAGKPPFNSDGLFVNGGDGLPVQQRMETVPVVITLPRKPMPANGYPLVLYVHGSGGVSYDVLDKGPSKVLDHPLPGLGPAWVHAQNGVAAAGSALPVNPERLPGAADTAYLNLGNPAALRDTFRQGVIEQRQLLRALLALRIDPALLAGCGGTLPTLPSGATVFKFDGDKVIGQGQSMGGMYTNLVSAVEPKIKIAVPTGAGGYWTWFITVTQLYGEQPALSNAVAGLVHAATPLTFFHPVLAMMQAAWEPNDPFVAMPRLARRPLAGHPVRSIYEPVGRGDQYFPIELYDAVALNYGHQEAGVAVWPSMQGVLKLGGLDGLLSYPVAGNRTSEGGVPYTGAVIQFEGDGIEDPHAIYRQLDSVKRQYSCFVKSWLDTGTASIPAPGVFDGSCN